MKHVVLISRDKPPCAQMESLLQLVGLLSALLNLVQQVADTFGLTIPRKSGTADR